MILGFKDRFEPMLTDGSKTHTIRSGKRWKVGMRADLYLSPRNKNMRLLFRATVKRVQEIRISCDPNKRGDGYPSAETTPLAIKTDIYIDGERLDPEELDLFAWRDGFREVDYKHGYWAQMVRFWEKQHGFGRSSFDFAGQIIHWDFESRWQRFQGSEPR